MIVAIHVLLYALMLHIYKTDTAFTYRWALFAIYVISIGTVCIYYFSHTWERRMRSINKSDILACFGVFVAATVLSFIFLKEYPYIAIGDELRDSGLDAQRIVLGSVNNFFAYGHYNGFGNMVPVVASFFYRLFGPSVYTYRIPSAIVSILDVVLLFLLLRRITDRWVAMLGSLSYAALPLHLFYGRTELVVIFDSLWTTAILLTLLLWLKNKNLSETVLLGTVLGVASNFHSAVRIVALAVLAIVLILQFLRIFKHRMQSIICMMLLVLYFFIGFGPSILNSDGSTFFQSDKIMGSGNVPRTTFFTMPELQQLQQNYAKSLMVWFYEPAQSHYFGGTPLLPPLLGMLFILGIGYAVFVEKKFFTFVLLGFVVLLPLTNSAITNLINADHRIMPMLPIGAIFFTVGMHGLFRQMHKFEYKYFFAILCSVQIVFMILVFFHEQSAVKNKRVHDYLSMNFIYLLQDKKVGFGSPAAVCLDVSPSNFELLDPLQYKEQREFFLPKYIVGVSRNEKISDTELYIYNGSCDAGRSAPKNKLVTKCEGAVNYRCPTDFQGDLTIYY
jgi:hypothetical protein